jgi:Ribbon-helix-helix protein, copG family
MATATERVVLLMSPDEKARLANLARQSGTSIGEFVRRLIRERASDSELAAEIEGRRPEFEVLLSELENSASRAHAALDAALDEAESTRRYFRNGRAERVAS